MLKIPSVTDTAQKYFEAAIEFSESAPLGLLQLLADCDDSFFLHVTILVICDNMDRFVDLNLNKLSRQYVHVNAFF